MRWIGEKPRNSSKPSSKDIVKWQVRKGFNFFLYFFKNLLLVAVCCVESRDDNTLMLIFSCHVILNVLCCAVEMLHDRRLILSLSLPSNSIRIEKSREKSVTHPNFILLYFLTCSSSSSRALSSLHNVTFACRWNVKIMKVTFGWKE